MTIVKFLVTVTKLQNKRVTSFFLNLEYELQVELGFTIPFITIPIKGIKGDDSKPLVNVNVGAITAGTILTTAALIFIPKAFSGLEPEITFGRSKFNYGSTNTFKFAIVITHIDRDFWGMLGYTLHGSLHCLSSTTSAAK